jgi:F-type H+-transporting ATPase subunit delta
MASVTNIYARALADVIVDKRLDANQAVKELRGMVALFETSSDLRKIWEMPSIAAEQKRKVLDAIVAREGFSKQLRNFIAVLIDHRRTAFLPDIARQVEVELNERLGFAEAEVTSVRELTDAEKRTLEAQVERLTGKRVRARYAQDASLLGGAVVKVGSTIYDGSVKGQLEKIREQLSSS